MATAELVACLPVLVLLLAFALSVVSVGSARVRAQDAAREAARAAARGDLRAAHRLAAETAPGSSIAISTSTDEVAAVVRLHAPLFVDWLPSVDVTERAVAAAEPTAPP
jgi:Flp pilus assembly protein TadG